MPRAEAYMTNHKYVCLIIAKYFILTMLCSVILLTLPYEVDVRIYYDEHDNNNSKPYICNKTSYC